MKKYGIILILTTLILLAGCTTTSSTTQAYYKFTGDKAIEATFVEYAPVSSETDTYQKGEEIAIAVELSNMLTEAIPESLVKVRLTGDAAIDAFFTGAKEVSSPELDARDITTGDPDTEEIEPGPIVYVGEVTTKVSKEITGQYCYEYPVKVKANLFYTNKEEEIGNNLPQGSNPASSVQVTEITQGVVDVDDNVGELKFQVTIENIGEGTVVSSLSDCFAFRDRQFREELKLTAEGAYDITCKDDGQIKLSTADLSKTLDCTVTGIDATNLGDQASELTLTLSGFAYEEELEPVMIWLEP
ncbi:MAG: hypothetical protein ABIF40_00100 [archaeon]